MKKNRILAGLLAFGLIMGCASMGLAEWKEETKGGKLSRRIWVDSEGNLSESPEGYSIVTFSYSGTSVTEKYFDAEGTPVQLAGGYYSRVLTYGNRHRLEELVYLDDQGNRVNCTAGYARMRVGYTMAGGVTLASYYDASGDLKRVPQLGYAQVKNDYRGTTLTRTTYLDENKNPVDTPLGYAVRVQSVNKSNKITGVRFEHADGSAASCAEGRAVMREYVDSFFA